MLNDDHAGLTMNTPGAGANVLEDDSPQSAPLSTRSPRPIFVIGSLRSGVSLLTLCLGQHPHIRQVAENDWLHPFVNHLQQAYTNGTISPATSQLAVSGVEVEDFFDRFGHAVDHLMLGAPADGGALENANGGYHPERWVDGTPAHSLLVFPLTRLFPAAKFIHVLRDVNEVVASLTDKRNRAVYKSQSIHMTTLEAYDHWRRTVLACVAAEQAFGSDTILRVKRDDLITRPEATIRHCLDFLDEPFTPACLRPFH